jgi:hypothetical protein
MKIKRKEFLFAALVLLIAEYFCNSIGAGTYGIFNSHMKASMTVNAASADDILTWDINYDKYHNALEIVIKKADDLGYDPTIYFSVEGSAADYIGHINPVKLEEHSLYLKEDESYHIPIKIRMNYGEFLELSNDKEKNVAGEIKLKYLDEYINESRDIRFTKKYLRDEFDKYGDMQDEKLEVLEKIKATTESQVQIGF